MGILTTGSSVGGVIFPIMVGKLNEFRFLFRVRPPVLSYDEQTQKFLIL